MLIVASINLIDAVKASTIHNPFYKFTVHLHNLDAIAALCILRTNYKLIGGITFNHVESGAKYLQIMKYSVASHITA